MNILQLQALINAGWQFRERTYHDGKDLYLQIDAKSPHPLLTEWFEVAESRHASFAELASSLTFESCLNAEADYFAREFVARKKFAIEALIKEAFISGKSKVTISI